MKIYNKKGFLLGVFMIMLGIFNCTGDIVNETIEAKGILLILALFSFGIGAIRRSVSQKYTREEKFENLDERNQLIALKSKSKSFRLTQGISFFLMLSFFVMGKVSGYEGFIAMGTGLAFAFTISMFAEIFTFMYYETKN